MPMTPIVSVQVGQTLEVTSTVAVGAVHFFRQNILLTFATSDIENRIVVNTNATTLKANFQPYDYDVLDTQTESLLAATVTNSSEAVIIALNAPRTVRQVKLSTSILDESLKLYRLDGNVLTDNPTVTASAENRLVTFSNDEAFTDIRFAIQSTVRSQLRRTHLNSLHVRSYPTGSRIGIADPAILGSTDLQDLSSITFFWRIDGEVGKTIPLIQGRVDAGEALANELQRYLDQAVALLAKSSAVLPDTIDVALVVESDAPCLLTLTDLNISYLTIPPPFVSSEGKKMNKHVLRYPGDQLSAQEIPMQIPSDVTIKSAILKTVESFGKGRVASESTSGLSQAALSLNTGVFIGTKKWAAQEILPTQAISVSGMALGLMALKTETILLVEIQEDWQGKPSGKKLSEGMIILTKVAQRRWFSLLLSETITLSSQPYWILMKAVQGCAVWFVQPSQHPVHVMEQSSRTATWIEHSVLNGHEGLYQFFSQNVQLQQTQSPVTLSLGGQIVTHMNNSNDHNSLKDSKIFDLTTALNAYLAIQPPSSAPRTLSLTFTAAPARDDNRLSSTD